MPAQRSSRRSRKRRTAGRAPRAVPSERRRRETAAAEPGPRPRPAASTYGQRPAGPFGAIPVSEVAIAAGLVAVVIGWLQSVPGILFVGVGVCFLGVLEVTAREHFSGYRSHSALLAGMVAVLAETGIALLAAPRTRALLLVVVVPVFAGVFVLLRRRFTAARQARVRALPPA